MEELDWETLLNEPATYNKNLNILDDEFINVDEINDKKIEEKKDENICKFCKTYMQVNKSSIVCKNCGWEKELKEYAIIYGSTNMDGNNISENSFVSLKIVGKTSYQHNKNLIQNCSDYEKYSYNNNIKDLRKIIYQLDDKQIPDNVIVGANNLYMSIKKTGSVFRGNSRKGILANCISIICDSNNIPKTVEYLCATLNISEKYFSQGNKIIHDLVEKKLITLPEKNNRLENFIVQYLSSLQIDIIYKEFLIEIINIAENNYLHLLYNCRDSTKCCGVILLLTYRVKDLNNVDSNLIAKKCKVSKTTFKKYTKLIIANYKLFKPAFKKYKIKMPLSWKN